MAPTTCYMFRLYLAGNTPNSAQAKANLGSLCRLHLPGRYKIEVVDVFKDPNRALTDGIFMTPSLVKLAPSPVRMIVGTLDRSDALLEALGLSTKGTHGSDSSAA
jgi:circadian clock protein KaiB